MKLTRCLGHYWGGVGEKGFGIQIPPFGEPTQELSKTNEELMTS